MPAPPRATSLRHRVLAAGGRITTQGAPPHCAAAVAVAGGSAVGHGKTQEAALADALARIPAWTARAAGPRCGCGEPMRRGQRACDTCDWKNRAGPTRVRPTLRAHRVRPHLRLLTNGTAVRVISHTRGTGHGTGHGSTVHSGSSNWSNRPTDPHVHHNMSDSSAPVASSASVPAVDPDAPRRREFNVLLAKRAHVQTALDAINKRAAKKGLPLIEYVWGAPYDDVYIEYAKDDPYHLGKGRKVITPRIPLALVGEKPSYAGWTFVATLQHLDGENIVRTVPGEVLPPAYRHRGAVCDHCRLDRRRADTYVVRHEDGRFMQVGRTCIHDFLGSAKAENVASYAQWFADAADVAEDGEREGGGGRHESVFTMAGYLAVVAAAVRVTGWLSRTAAREREKGMATADLAWRWLDDQRFRQECRKEGIDLEPTDADTATAEAAVAWAERLTDAQIDAERGDYLHNLRAVARSGMVTHRLAGLAGSVVPAYQRAIGQLRKREAATAEPRLDAYVGTVGERSLWTLTLDHVTGWQGDYGYTTLLKFKTAEGADVAWKASGVPGTMPVIEDGAIVTPSKELSAADVGKVYTVLGTVKKHEEYKGRKQTQLSRCELHEGLWTPPAKVKKVAKPKPATTRTKEIVDAAAADDNIMVMRSYGKGATVEFWVNGNVVGKVSFADFTKAMALGELHTLYPGALDRIGGQSPIVRGPAPAPVPVAPASARDPETQDPVDPKAPRAPLAGEEGYSPYRTDDHYH